jgi:colanic acid biosynthesis glycosyl transferase WcaI
MNILLLTQLFQPEPNHLKGLAFAKKLAELGHHVEVLTGFPNYPGGRLYPGYKRRWRMRETMDGIPVIRVLSYLDHSHSGVRRFFSYVTLALAASVTGIFSVRRPDVIHVYQGPATLAFPAIWMRLVFGARYVLDIQDLWPESVIQTGMFRLPGGEFLLKLWCKLTYKLAHTIVVLSPGYKESLIQKGVPSSKIEVIYNWCNETEPSAERGKDALEDPSGLSGLFHIVYAGNLGRLQALDSVIHAAGILQKKEPAVRFVFVGDGVDALRLKRLMADEGVSNVRFIPRQPVENIGAMLAKADALLVHLKDEPLCRIGIPQKTQAYLAAGRPIIAAVRGDVAALVQRAKAGIVCEPENAASLAEAVERVLKISPAQRQTMGRNGREYYDGYLSFPVGIRKFVSLFEKARP